MSDTSSGGKRSRAKKSAKRGKGAKRKDVRASEGVLANLSRTRPQRSSARRDAARRAASAKVEPTGAPERILAKKRPSKSKVKAKRLQDPVPRQGFETEGDPVSGPVQPPGGVDLLSSAAELAGELTKTGLSTGGRLLKDFLGRLPLN
jgi:hypothetical protein